MGMEFSIEQVEQNAKWGKVNTLKKALKSNDRGVRIAAIEALGSIGNKRINKRLINLLAYDADGKIREKVAESLCAKNDDAVRNALIMTVENDPEFYVRKAAADTLGNSDDKRATACLVHSLGDTALAVKESGKKGLRKLGKPLPLLVFISDLKSDQAAIRDLAMTTLVEEYERSVEPLLEILDLHPYPDQYIGRAEEKRRNEAVLETLGRIVERDISFPFVKALKNKDFRIRANAIEYLPRFHDKSLAAPLLELFEHPIFTFVPGTDVLAISHEDEELRIIRTLGEIGDESAIEPLHRRLGGTSTGSAIYEALGKIGGSRVVDILLSELKTSRYSVDPYVRTIIICILGDIGDKRIVEPMMEIIEDPDECRLHASAIRALGEIGDPKAFNLLNRTVNSKKNSSAPLKFIDAIDALAKIGDKRAVKTLMKVLDDSFSENRNAAARAIIEIGDEKSIIQLNDIITDSKADQFNSDTKKAVIKAIDKIQKTEAQ